MIAPVKALLIVFAALAATQPPAWIQRVVPPPIVAWREADVLGTPIVEGIAVDVVQAGRETAYLLRVGRSFELELVRTVHGTGSSPGIFAR